MNDRPENLNRRTKCRRTYTFEGVWFAATVHPIISRNLRADIERETLPTTKTVLYVEITSRIVIFIPEIGSSFLTDAALAFPRSVLNIQASLPQMEWKVITGTFKP